MITNNLGVITLEVEIAGTDYFFDVVGNLITNHAGKDNFYYDNLNQLKDDDNSK